MLVLRMLAEGKITATEAAELLRVLGGQSAESKTENGENSPPPNYGREERRNLLGNLAEKIGQEIKAHLETVTDQEGPKEFKGFSVSFPPKDKWPGGFPWVWGGLSGLANVFSFAFEGGPRYTFTETREGELDPGETVELDLKLVNGSLIVHNWEGTGFKLILEKKVSAPTEEAAREKASEIGHLVTGPRFISLRHDEKGAVRNSVLSAELYLPAGSIYRGVAQSVNGKVQVEGLNVATLTASTVNGSVVVRHLRGQEIFLKTVNGSLRYWGQVTSVRAHTVNGSIRVHDQGGGQASYDLSTTSGGIRFHLADDPETGYQVQASSAAGGIRLKAPRLVEKAKSTEFAQRKVVAETSGFAECKYQVTVNAKTSAGGIRFLPAEVTEDEE